MEHRNDPELHDLLKEWKAPAAPASLESRVLKNRSWWNVLLHGYIRVPVPVACCLAIVIIGGAWRLATLSVNGCSAAQAAVRAIEHAPAEIGCAIGSKC